MTITIHPSTTQQSLMQQLNEVVYLSTEWWRIKEYSNKRCWEHDWRWHFMEGVDHEAIAWKAKDWCDTRGFELIDIKPITGSYPL